MPTHHARRMRRPQIRAGLAVIVAMAVIALVAIAAVAWVLTGASPVTPTAIAVPPTSETALRARLADPNAVARGKALFPNYCASCHGNAAAGGTGPNLRDEVWLHGNSMRDVVAAIADGFPYKGMAPWRSVLTRDQIEDLAVFVASLGGIPAPPPSAPAPAPAPSP